ncbi:MAG: glycosyltransferase [Tunicatimonas sp.]|uniref:glycosyltransferase n=1 Tax=Tunicatimonas sp. TaxID=1940096 RepID=UPI003C780D57
MEWVAVFVFVAAGLFQLYWYYTLYAIWKTYHLPTSTTSHQPPISIIVCAYNEIANLRILLPLLCNQQYPTYEIVVVEDTSYDGSLDFLLAQKEKLSNLKIVWLRDRPEHVGGKKYALTLGIQAARYQHLLLTDADCRPVSSFWICKMVQAWSSDCEFVLGYSPYQTLPGLLNGFIRYETLHTGMTYLGAALRGYPYMGVGRNLAYRKLFFLDKRGFRGFWHLTGGDDDIFVNQHATDKNTTIAIHQESQMISVPKTSWRAYIRQKVRHLSVGKFYKVRDKRWLGAFSLTTIGVWLAGGLLLFTGAWILALLGMLVRWGMMAFAFRSASNKLNDSIPLHMLPIFDFLYVIYYMSIGPIALLSKHIRWK